MAWSENRLHEWILRLRASRPEGRRVVGAPGSDAAVLRAGTGRVAMCVDQVVEGVHVEPRTPAARVGRKAALRALSDLAATAARPEALVLALRAPAEREERWLRGAIEGTWRCAHENGALLVGGDLCCAPGPAALTVTALGRVASDRPPPGRERVRPGDRLILTGPVGGSRLGRHLRFVPRLDLGRWLHAHGAHAMLDVSDGLALDLARLARRSGVRIDLDLASVPVHPDARRAARASGRTALAHALDDGEDHELVAAVPARGADALLAAARRFAPGLAARGGLVAIGRARTGQGLWLVTPEGTTRWSGEGGWVHGSA